MTSQFPTISRYCNGRSVQETDLDKNSTFFMEYILEKADVKDFFRKYVAGFSIGPLTSIQKNWYKVMPPNPTIVWFSGLVSSRDRFILRSVDPQTGFPGPCFGEARMA